MSYVSEVLSDTPWLYWRLDDQAGITAVDTSGNGRTGTYSGSPTLAQSPLITEGTSVLFDATNDYALSSAIFNSSTATVEVWFDYDGIAPSPGQYALIAGCNEGDGGGVGEKLIFIANDGSGGGVARFYVYDGAQKIALGTTVLSTGRHHLVGTVDGSTATIYVDGASDGSIGASGSYAGYTNPNAMVGGLSSALGAAGPVREAGRRDEFALYTTRLSAARVLAHYQAGTAAAVIQVPVVRHALGAGRW